jgi:hypothetical protein
MKDDDLDFIDEVTIATFSETIVSAQNLLTYFRLFKDGDKESILQEELNSQLENINTLCFCLKYAASEYSKELCWAQLLALITLTELVKEIRETFPKNVLLQNVIADKQLFKSDVLNFFKKGDN